MEFFVCYLKVIGFIVLGCGSILGIMMAIGYLGSYILDTYGEGVAFTVVITLAILLVAIPMALAGCAK